jgi:uncharacterized protein (DUF697 family)
MGMTSTQREKCASIISKASATGRLIAGTTALTSIPLAATLSLMALEFQMVRNLGKVFDIDMSEANVKGVMGAIGAAIIGNGIYEVGMGIVGSIPLIGALVGGLTAPFVITNLGWRAANHFAKNTN